MLVDMVLNAYGTVWTMLVSACGMVVELVVEIVVEWLWNGCGNGSDFLFLINGC